MKIWTSEDTAKWPHYKQILKQFCFMFFVLATLLTYAQDPYGGMSKKQFKRFVKRELEGGNSVEWSREGGISVAPNADYLESRKCDAERSMEKAKREMREASDNAFRNPGSVGAQQEYDAAERTYRRAKRDFEDAEIQSQNAKAQRELWGDDEERNNRSTFIVDEDDVVGGDNGVFVRDGRMVQVQPPRPEWPVITDIYPGGAVKPSCTIVPNLRLKTDNYRSAIVGQISVTLQGGLQGEPIVCLYVLSRKNDQVRRMGEYDAGRNKFDFHSVAMRPVLGSPMREHVYDGWESVGWSSRVKYGPRYSGEGTSIEEKSMVHHIPTLKRFTMNESTPAHPFISFYGSDQVGVALYHIEVWHDGKCIGIKDGQVGSGIITPPCKDWFVRE